jgi:hypothetical protein
MSNTYRFSTRDGVKHITKNGEEIISLLGEHGWGWYGRITRHTAMCILATEYGWATAVSYTIRFAREYLAEMTADNFTWTSGAIACMIHEMEKDGS